MKHSCHGSLLAACTTIFNIGVIPKGKVLLKRLLDPKTLKALEAVRVRTSKSMMEHKVKKHPGLAKLEKMHALRRLAEWN